MTSVINNKKTESHLCADCAAKHGGSGSPFGTFGFGGSIFDNDFFTNDFFTNAVYPDGMLGRRGQTCSGCGMTFAVPICKMFLKTPQNDASSLVTNGFLPIFAM